jgi:hypothetical protein
MDGCEKCSPWKLHYQVTSEVCGGETELKRNNRGEGVTKTPIVK